MCDYIYILIVYAVTLCILIWCHIIIHDIIIMCELPVALLRLIMILYSEHTHKLINCN